MSVHNAEIADSFDTLANLLEIEGANPFRVRAYRDAARIIGSLPQEAEELLREGGDLTELPGIGKDLANKVKTMVETGSLPLLEEVEQRVPRALSDLTRIGQLGPKRVRKLYDILHVRSLSDLDAAARAGRVRELPGFGEKTEQLIRTGIARLRGETGRISIAAAEGIGEALRAYLAAVPGVDQAVIAGSYRRRRETVGDLDILVSCRPDSPVMERFVTYDEVAEVISHGETRSTVRLRSGMQVDVRVVPEESYGAALHYFTGSKAHNIAVRKIGVKKGLKINEYGVFRGERRVGGRTEEEVFALVDLPFIPPELREDRGEIDAAREKRLPRLITLADIRGDLHAHTKVTDGRSSLEQMVEAAQERGYDYLAITDHSKRVTVARGLDEARLTQQLHAIDRIQTRFPRIRILKSIELDILEDGSLDLADSVLKELDLTVCSVHSHFNLPAKQQTERIMRAMDNRYFTILAHPTGRLINRREPYELDMDRIVEAAAERGCFLELNSQPDRLDLTDAACKRAKELGVKVAISTDAHSTTDLGYIRFGIGQARRGWLEPEDVLNTRPWHEIERLVKRR